MSSTLSMMRSSGMQRQPPSQDKDVFKIADSDGNGVVFGTELDTLVKGIEEVTGNTIDQETLSSFDSDGDGGLNGEELLGLMQSNGFSGPEMLDFEGEEQGVRPPPPPPSSSEQAFSAYAENSGDVMIAQLIDVLQAGADETESSAIHVTS
jgi:hypothetical protein